MLKSKSIAKLIETTLNQNDKDERFRVGYEADSYKGADINCILKQGKGKITPIANYTNVNTPFYLEVIVPMQCGEDRVDNIVDIVNELIYALNGKVKNIDNGKAVFLFNPLEMGQYEARATVGQSILIRLEFIVEYSTNVGTKYEMALITTQFEKGTINTRYFENRDKQIEWYDSKMQEQGVEYVEVLTPNINSLTIIQQRYLNLNNYDLNNLLNKNFAIIKETDFNKKSKYYYYYITNSSLDQYNQVLLDLSMDTLQTHYIDLRFGDCFISKADINRWKEIDNNTVTFDTTKDSELFERENVANVTKRLVKRDVLNKFGQVIYNSTTINDWLDENVAGWYYIFISKNAPVPALSVVVGESGSVKPEINLKSLAYAKKDTIETLNLSTIKETSLYNTMVCVTFPLMKNNRKLYFANVDTQYDTDGNKTEIIKGQPIEISNKSFEIFLENLSTDYIYSMKFSQISPFKYVDGFIADNNNAVEDGNLVLYGQEIVSEVTISEEGVEKKKSYKSLKPRNINGAWEVEAIPQAELIDFSAAYGFLNFLLQTNIETHMGYSIENIKFTFTKREIVESEHDIKFNPKLLSADYMSLILSDSLQNGAEYDILKLGKNYLDISYTEALTPDITKRYIRISNLSGVYIPELAENLTGYIVNDDTSFTLESSQYKSMLANNKNFFLQNYVNRENNLNQTQLSTITTLGYNMSTLSLTNVLRGGIGIAGNIANTLLNNNNSKISESLTVDNLKNAPNSINGAKGNVIFNAMYSKMGVVVEIHDIFPNEKKMIDDMIKMNGMSFNKIDNIKKYDNIRAYHNYIQANIEDIIGEISNPIRDDIRQRFAEGVRFWNVDEINYEKENYERWLEA